MTFQDFQYECAGLRLKSEFELPGYARLNASSKSSPRAADVEIGTKPSLPKLKNPQLTGPNWQANRREFLLSIPSVCEIYIAEGKSIAFAGEKDGATREYVAFLAKALEIALLQRGIAALQCSAVEVNGKAVLFCSREPRGESTLAASLALRGYRPLAEGFCALQTEKPGEVLAVPDGRCLQLWDDSIAQLNLTAQAGGTVRAGLHKRHMQIETAASKPLELAAIYFILPYAASASATIHALDIVDGPKRLLANGCGPRLAAFYDVRNSYLVCAASMLRDQAIFTIEHSQKMSDLGLMAVSLENHWRDLQFLD